MEKCDSLNSLNYLSMIEKCDSLNGLNSFEQKLDSKASPLTLRHMMRHGQVTFLSPLFYIIVQSNDSASNVFKVFIVVLNSSTVTLS